MPKKSGKKTDEDLKKEIQKDIRKARGQVRKEARDARKELMEEIDKLPKLEIVKEMPKVKPPKKEEKGTLEQLDDAINKIFKDSVNSESPTDDEILGMAEILISIESVLGIVDNRRVEDMSSEVLAEWITRKFLVFKTFIDRYFCKDFYHDDSNKQRFYKTLFITQFNAYLTYRGIKGFLPDKTVALIEENDQLDLLAMLATLNLISTIYYEETLGEEL